MSEYATLLRQHARIAILRFLEGAPQYTSNASLLMGLLPQVGVKFTYDQVVTELNWLQEQGFVTLEEHPGVLIAEATQRGTEIATGVATHPDIKRPSAER